MTHWVALAVLLGVPCMVQYATPAAPGPEGRPSPDVAQATWRRAKRVVIFVVGVTVMLAGVALLVLPGPAFIVIPAGLAILATEFVWARRWLRRAKRDGGRLGRWIMGQGEPEHVDDRAASSHRAKDREV